MMKTLTSGQLNHISKLIKMKGVTYYDLKMELVDHIANEVEEELNKNTNLDYLAAVKKVFLRYGPHPFGRLQEKETKKLRQLARTNYFEELKSFFNIPKIIATFLLFSASLWLLKYADAQSIFGILYLLYITLFIHLYILKKNLFGKKSFLRLTKFYHYSFTPMVIQIVLKFILDLVSFYYDKSNTYYLNGVLITFFALTIYITFELARNQLLLLKKQYA